MNIIASIKRHEGFSERPYPDPIRGWDVPTFGYGFTYLTKDEADYLLRRRINNIKRELSHEKGFFIQLPQEVQDVVAEMAYQLGVGGVLKFKKMWAALAERDYDTAAKEAMDSKWAKQTPNRASELAGRLRDVAETVR